MDCIDSSFLSFKNTLIVFQQLHPGDSHAVSRMLLEAHYQAYHREIFHMADFTVKNK